MFHHIRPGLPHPMTITQCTYNTDNQILTVNNGMYVDTFVYGANGDRFRVDMSKSGTFRDCVRYILTTASLDIIHLAHFMYGRTIIYAPTGVCAVFQDTIGSPSKFILYSYRLFGIVAFNITNSSGARVTNSYSYDAWGRPRISENLACRYI